MIPFPQMKRQYYPSSVFTSFSIFAALSLALSLSLTGKRKITLQFLRAAYFSFRAFSLLLSLFAISMAFSTFIGRVLFASVFILSAYQQFNEYGDNGGPAAKAFRPKFDNLIHRVQSHVGLQLPEFDMKYVVAGAIALKGIGGILFILGSSFGAFLLLLHQMIATPILYDFYNYETEDKEFTQLFIKFTQNMAFFGALLFFIGMKNSIPRRQPKKKAPKTKIY